MPIVQQLMFVETDQRSTTSTVEKLHAEAVLLHSNETVRLSRTTDNNFPVLDVYGHVCADKIRGRSDARLKTDIKELHDALDVISRLSGKSYRMRGGKTESYGLLAQDVARVIPSVVEIGDDGYYDISYLEIIPFLIEAIKELDHRTRNLT
jgi:hypothetical protein